MHVGNIFDIDNYTDPLEDVVSSIADNIGDAGKIVGAAMRFVAPIVAMWPGIGTAASVALSAASAVAMGTPVDDALLQTASNAIPGGLPRIGFDTAVNTTKDVVAGRNAFGSVTSGLRAAAQQAGGDRARFAFDSALSVARGDKISDQALRAARDQAAQGGTQALAAFDAGVAVGRGEGAEGAALAVARDYIAATGNPIALASFDTGIALAHGQALQDAGFAGLQALVAGNESAERAVRYLQKIERAARTGQDLYTVLVTDLSAELAPFVGQLDAGKVLQPFVEAMQIDPSALTWGSQALADAWDVGEPIVRAAQAIMRNGETPDVLLQNTLLANYVKSIGRVALSAEDVAAEAARWAAVVAANPGVPEACLHADEARRRGSVAFEYYETQCKAAGGRPIVKQQVAASAASSSSILRVSSPTVKPKSVAVPFKPASVVQASRPADEPSVGSDLLVGGVVGVAALGLLWLAAR